MYDLIDRDIASLAAIECDLLDRMRRWVHAFSIAGVDAVASADESLSRALHALDAGSREDVVIQRPCFATVDETEAVILGLWRLVREGRDPEAFALALMLVDAEHAPRLLAGLAGVALR